MVYHKRILQNHVYFFTNYYFILVTYTASSKLSCVNKKRCYTNILTQILIIIVEKRYILFYTFDLVCFMTG